MLGMRQVKNVLAMLLSVCMVTQSVPVTAYAAEPETQAVEACSEEESAAALESSTSESETETRNSTLESETETHNSTPESETEMHSSTSESETEVESEAASESSTEEEASEEFSGEETKTQEPAAEEIVTEEDSVEVPETEEEAGNEVKVIASEIKLSLGEADVEIQGFSSVYDYQGLVFVAPEDGTYIFSMYSKKSYYVDTKFYKTKSNSTYTDLEDSFTFSSNREQYYTTAMKKGEARYIAMNVNWNNTCHIGIQKAPEVTNLVETATGYRVETEQFTANIDIDAGYTQITSSTKLTAKNGVELPDNYWLKMYVKEDGCTKSEVVSQQLKESSRYNLTVGFRDLKMNTTYTIFLYLCDYETGKPVHILLSENDNIRRTMSTTDKEFVIRDLIADYDQVTMKFEKINDQKSYYYTCAPKSDPSSCDWYEIYSSSNTQTIESLDENTEYIISVYDDLGGAGHKVDEKAVKTKKLPMDVTYDVKAAGPDTITLSAQISGLTDGEPEETPSLVYSVRDENGELVKSASCKGGSFADNKYQFDTITIDDLECGKKYKVIARVRIGDIKSASQTMEVTTDDAPFKADDVIFTFQKDTSDDSAFHCTVGVKNYSHAVKASIQCRVKAPTSIFSTRYVYTIESGKTLTQDFINMQKGCTYEVRLKISGMVLIKEFTLEGTDYVAEFSDDTDEYDSLPTLKLKAPDGTELDSGTECEVYMTCNDDNGRSHSIISKGELNSDNQFRITGNTAGVLALKPDTTYTFEWVIKVTTNKTTRTKMYYQTIKTKKGTVKAEIKKEYIDGIDFDLALGGRTQNISEAFYLYTYIKEGDGDFGRIYNQDNDYWFEADNGYKLTNCSLKNLKPDTGYTVSMRDSAGNDYGTFKFKTPADDKTITVTAVEPDLHFCKITYTKCGNNYARTPERMIIKIREKGTETWECAYYDSSSANSQKKATVREYKGDVLKEDTTYEYTVGYTVPQTTGDQLKSTVQGTFKTLKDERKLEGVSVSTGYDSAKISAKVVDNIHEQYTAVYILTRETGTDDWECSSDSRVSSDTSFVVNRDITDLKMGTKYDFAVVIADSEGEYRDPYVFPDNRRYIGSFETKKIEIPQSITLSQKELKLNMGYDETATLRATLTPATAAADVVWTSSDENVVKVAADGTVTAVGRGEAVITVASKYSASVKEECKVSVKFYVVVCKGDTHMQPVYDTVSGFKGEAITNIGFYEQSAEGKYTAISGFNVVSKTPSIADWEDNSIKAKSVGYTDLTFEKDGYKATIGVFVSTNRAGFGITGLRASNTRYSAIRRGEDQYELAYGEKLKLNYQAEGMISPDTMEFEASDFIWESTDQTVAEVSDGGLITPKKAGTVKVTVKPNRETEAHFDPEKSKVELTLNIKPTPTNSEPEIYVVTNEKSAMKLADVSFPAEWGEGWEWKEPHTPLYSLPVHSAAYAFNATYTGDTYYAYEGTVNVFISTITGVSISEKAGNHRSVIKVSEGTQTDTLSLQIMPGYYGKLAASKYTVKVPDVKNLTITKNDKTGCYDITAGKKGTYTIKPQILVGDKVVATGSYRFKAVSTSQIERITLTTDGSEGAVIKENKISFDTSAETTAGSSFTLKAAATDRDGLENTTTKLAWSITDKSVATIRVSADSRTATVTVKGSGHAVIQVTARDETAVSAQWKLEIQDHRPRISTNKVTVNTAYDYDSDAGRNAAHNQNGSIEIVPVYGESIKNVRIINAKTDEVDTGLGIVNISDHDWVVKPIVAEMGTNKAYPCRLEVTTSAGTYTYPLTAAIIHKMPKVTAKLIKGVNLFYTADEGEVEIKLESTLFKISSLVWEDAAQDNGANAFERTGLFVYLSRPYNQKYCRFKQDMVRVENGRLVDKGVDQITMKLKLTGVREEYQIPLKIKTTYQKPKLKIQDLSTGKNVSNIIPSANGGNVMHFSVYDNVLKSTLSYTTEDVRSKYYYDKISCDSSNISLSPYDYSDDHYSGMTAVYSGTGKQETLNYTIESAYWREPLRASHTIRTITPKAVISNNSLTFNTNYANSDTVRIDISGASGALELSDVEIRGANAKAQALLDEDKLFLMHMGSELQIHLNKLGYMKGDVPTGKYTYNLVPYYTNAQTGEKAALNTLKLVINFTNREITAKVSTKGSIDLSQSNNNSLGTNRIAVTAKFSNIGSDCVVTGARLTGEYSKYFSIRKYANPSSNPIYYIKINSSQKGKLKAGQNYKLQVVYTLQATGKESFEVTSNVVNVKPKQTVPKITVAKNNQTLYVASNLSRIYTISVPNSSYGITDACGSIDVNKDGVADITVTTNSISEQSADLKVQITDQDAIPATAGGKTYSIPVAVKVLGRDGIAKDASVVIKAKVKR